MRSGILPVLSILVLTSRGENSCTLSESVPSPYLIRIFEAGTDPVTYGHGSLIRQDKVLSTCTPFKDLPKDLVNGKWRLSGYNFLEKCEQKRHPLEIEIHEACKKPNPNMIDMISLDVALWTVEPFAVQGTPFLWGSGRHLPPPLKTVESIFSSLAEKKMEFHVVLFEEANSESVELQPSTEVEFIGQSDCVDMLKNITSTFGIEDVLGDNKNVFCAHDRGIKWVDSKNASNPFDADFYSGAAVIAVESDSNNSIPVGLMSRRVTVTSMLPDGKNFRIILGFDDGVYDFLAKNGIETQELPPSTTSHGRIEQSSCKLRESGHYPYLIRILQRRKKKSITHGHGSLIKDNKVLSTCTPFRSLAKSLMKTDWKLTGYNFVKRCKQEREPTEIVMHESCHKPQFPSSNAPITHDFAVWTVDPFAIAGMPYLWGNGKPQPPPLSRVTLIIDSLLKFRKALKVGLFSLGDSDGPELQSGAKIDFIDWFVCLDMLKNVTVVTGDMIDGLNSSTSLIEGFYDYFCGLDVGVKWLTSRISNPLNPDWYSGAAVTYELASGNEVPIGLLSRGVTVSAKNRDVQNFRIIMGFHKGLFEFLTDNGIEPSSLESSELKYPPPTTMSWWQSTPYDAPRGRHLRRSRDQYNHQTRLIGGDLWITHLTLLSCMGLQ